MQEKVHGALIYARVSTEFQARENTSIAEQLDQGRAEAARLNLPIIAEYTDEGVSGAFLTTRTGMQRVLADLRAGRADTLIVANMNRYSREREHQDRIRKDVRLAGGRLHFCDMNFEDTPEGDFAFGVMGNMAQYERLQFRSRSMRGHRRRAKDGIMSARRQSPYGYHIPTRIDILQGKYSYEQLGKYVVLEDQAAIVQWLFAAYGAGSTLNELAKQLNSRGIPTPRGGKYWCSTTIRAFLTNPVYKGTAVFGRYVHGTDEARLEQRHWRTGELLTSPRYQRKAEPADWIVIPAPALVSEELWDEANRKLRENKSKRGGNPQTVHMLSARVYCRQCESAMHRQAAKKENGRLYGPYYICGRYRKSVTNTGTAECVSTSYFVQDAEDGVKAAILSACRHPEAIEAALQVYAHEGGEPIDPVEDRRRLADVDRALATLASKEADTVKAQIAGIAAGASPNAYAAVFADIAQRRQELVQQRDDLLQRARASNARCSRPMADTGAILEDVRLALDAEAITGAEKRDLVGKVIERVYCIKGGVDVLFKPALFTRDTLHVPRVMPEMSRLRAGKRQGSGVVPKGYSEMIAP